MGETEAQRDSTRAKIGPGVSSARRGVIEEWLRVESPGCWLKRHLLGQLQTHEVPPLQVFGDLNFYQALQIKMEFSWVFWRVSSLYLLPCLCLPHETAVQPLLTGKGSEWAQKLWALEQGNCTGCLWARHGGLASERGDLVSSPCPTPICSRFAGHVTLWSLSFVLCIRRV